MPFAFPLLAAVIFSEAVAGMSDVCQCGSFKRDNQWCKEYEGCGRGAGNHVCACEMDGLPIAILTVSVVAVAACFVAIGFIVRPPKSKSRNVRPSVAKAADARSIRVLSPAATTASPTTANRSGELTNRFDPFGRSARQFAEFSVSGWSTATRLSPTPPLYESASGSGPTVDAPSGPRDLGSDPSPRSASVQAMSPMNGFMTRTVTCVVTCPRDDTRG
jgi:hypothetical protein